MSRILCYLFPILFFSNSTNAEGLPKHLWGSIDAGIIGLSLSFNSSDGRNGWDASINKYGQFLYEGVVDSDTNKHVNTYIDSFDISKVWHRPYRWGSGEWGVGIAYVKGRWGRACVYEAVIVFGEQHCKVDDISTLGVPIHANINFGRYVGVGLFIRYLHTNKSSSGMAGITIPFGSFSKNSK